MEENKYEEALERAREIYFNKEYKPNEAALVKETLEELFPELKVSEDEQSKKWILEYLYDGLRKADEQFEGQFKAAIAWLEKQGEQKPTDLIDMVTKKSTWSEEDEYLLKWSLYNLQEIQHRFGPDYGIVGKCIDWLKSIKQRLS